MMRFYERFELAELFMAWAKKHNAPYTPINVITWLNIHNLIDEDRFEEFSKECASNGEQKTF